MRTGFLRLVFPYALLFLLVLAAGQIPVLTKWSALIPRFIPYVVWGTGALLGWRFNRSRVVFAMLVLAIADWSLVQFVSGGAAATPRGRLIHQAVAVLLPLNVLVFALAKERGVLTVRGGFRIAFLCCQPLAIAFLTRSGWKNVTTYLEHPFFKLPELARLPLAQPAITAFVLSLVVLAIQALRRQNAMESGFFWALLTAFGGFYWSRPSTGATLYLATAGLILLVAVVESSYAMAFRDELTGLPTRRALNESLLQLGAHYTVAMVDIDFFKKFNDRYGHDVGDQVLRKVAGILARVDGGGRAFRYGGEEFIIVFPEQPWPLQHLSFVVANAPAPNRSHRRKPQDRDKGFPSPSASALLKEPNGSTRLNRLSKPQMAPSIELSGPAAIAWPSNSTRYRRHTEPLLPCISSPYLPDDMHSPRNG
jgi:GGDEF domain-containing protein